MNELKQWIEEQKVVAEGKKDASDFVGDYTQSFGHLLEKLTFERILHKIELIELTKPR